MGKKVLFGFLAVLLVVFPVFLGCESAVDLSSSVNSADGVPIAYRVVGKGEPALVFVHGWCCDQSFWDAQVPEFSSKYKVVTLDLAGHGKSGLNRSAWTVPAFAEDVKAVVNKLGLKKVVLVGHSLAGSIIIEAARIMPDRVVALVGADTFTNIEVIATPAQLAQMEAAFKADGAGMMKNLIKGTMFTPKSDPALVERIYAKMSATPPERASAIGSGTGVFDAAKALEQVRVPVYCINSDPNKLNVETVRRHTSSFTPVFMSGVGHFVMIEDPQTFNRLLTDILKGLKS